MQTPTSLAQVSIKSFTSETVQTEAAKSLAQLLEEKLALGSVFLLLSGGSAIKMYQEAFGLLAAKQPSWSSLIVSLLDERAVPPHSPDSNEEQLRAAGVVEEITKRGGRWVSYLEHGENWPAAAEQTSMGFQQILSEHPYIIITAGIGDDGHTSGLLPTQDKSTIQNVFESSHLIQFYELPADTANPFRLRLTTTPAFIRQASEILIYAVGEKKRAALERFLKGEEQLSVCPALALRSEDLVTTLITDQHLS
jgi:6-phosphogluconolactonase